MPLGKKYKETQKFKLSHGHLKCPYHQNFYFPIWSYVSCNEHLGKKFSIWIKSDFVIIDVKYIWSNSYIWTAVVDQSEEWSSQSEEWSSLNKLASLPMCGFIAQLVEHRTGIAEVTGSNPVEALTFFRLLLSNCLNWKIYCDDNSSLWSTTAVQIYELFHIYFTSFHSSREIWTQ